MLPSDHAVTPCEPCGGSTPPAQTGVARATAMVAFVVLLGILLGLVARLTSLSASLDGKGNPVGGDFICFYPAARMILAGQGSRIYQSPAVEEMLREIVGSPTRFGAYQYPPTLAIALTSLAWLPMHVAFGAFVVSQVAAAAAAMAVLRRELKCVQWGWPVGLTLALLFSPLMAAILSGQNTAITLLLFSLILSALRRRRDAEVGLWLGLLAFKPQMALLTGTFLLLDGRWRAVAVASGVGIAHYLAGALAVGWDWPAQMMGAVRFYWPLERSFNGDQSISILALCDWLWQSPLARPTGALLSLAAAGMAYHHWRRDHGLSSTGFAVLPAATLLVSPHTLWYDAGLLICSLAVTADARLRAHGRLRRVDFCVVAACFLVPALTGLIPSTGIHAVAAIPFISLLWSLSIGTDRSRSDEPAIRLLYAERSQTGVG